MGYKIEFNTILSVPADQLKISDLKIGSAHTVTKPGHRIFPLNIPIDLSDSSYNFVAKVAIRKLTLSGDQTTLKVEILKKFSAEESKIISDNFSKRA